VSIRDTDIQDWSSTAASNPPADSAYIRGDLPRQWRNIKSIVRAESKAKQWQKTGLRTAAAVAGDPSAVAFDASDGNLTATFPVARKLRLRPTDGSTSYVYCGVLTSAHTSYTALTLADLSGVVVSGRNYFVDVGIEVPGSECLPLHVQSGTITITDPATSGVVTFPHAEGDENYFAKVSVISTTSAVEGAVIPAKITKGTTSMTIALRNAPGGGTNTVLAWSIMRELS